MDKVYTKLEQLNLDESNLPQSLNAKIDDLNDYVESFNKKIEYLQGKGLTQEQIDEATSDDDENIDIMEDDIVLEIESFYENTRGDSGKGNKKGWGMWVLGGLALVLTLGVVNVMKKN